jgi:prolyl-tRNA synthetase
MSRMYQSITIRPKNWTRYNSSISLDFQEACDLLETGLPALIQASLKEQSEEVADFKKNLARAKKLGLI